MSIRYMVVFGCGHPRKTHDTSSHPPTTGSVAYCPLCDRHVPLYLETLHIDGCSLRGDHKGRCNA